MRTEHRSGHSCLDHTSADGTPQTYHLRRMSAWVGPAYMALLLPPLSLVLGICLFAAAWCGISGDGIGAAAGGISLLYLAIHLREGPGASPYLWTAHAVFTLLCSALASALWCTPYWPAAATLSLLLTAVGLLGVRIVIARHHVRARRMTAYLDASDDAVLLEAMTPAAAEVARNWVEGRLEATAREEDVIRLALLHVALREAERPVDRRPAGG